MRAQVSRAYRGSISVLLFSVLAAGGISFGYLAATSSDQASLVSRADAKPAPSDAGEKIGGLLARVEPAVR
jgi:hypothetical protein